MAIPTLDQNGLLPGGIYNCTTSEIKIRFGAFAGTDQRPRLFQKLSDFILDAQKAGFASCLLIDGSFVTARLHPNDIDLVLVLRHDYDLHADLSPAQYALVSKRNVQRRYGFDIVVVRENTLEYDEAAAFFQQVRGQPGLQKGILKLEL